MTTSSSSAPASRPERAAFANMPPIDPEWEARKQRLWALTADERVAAMRARQLSYRELAHWSAQAPDEVPRLLTGNGDLFAGGEFEWIAALTPEIADAGGTAKPPRRQSANARRSR